VYPLSNGGDVAARLSGRGLGHFNGKLGADNVEPSHRLNQIDIVLVGPHAVTAISIKPAQTKCPDHLCLADLEILRQLLNLLILRRLEN
jgi:hypothetical protein